MAELLLYPQVVLLLAPLLLRAIWAAARPALLVMSSRSRAAVLFVMIVVPVAALTGVGSGLDAGQVLAGMRQPVRGREVR
ncbi:hypothetical protein JOE56_001751 [Brevibacterium paucivorans]|uniref:Uncharacterized protein n=1 Tax=Brevibacterium paucivorans TaxID=170994 RepID=A0ABS2SLB8_9MICO|nr:hypothetical protein [Brevibacterium paucivorans]MBM7817057.1 hypothetical protein [Brevibacterium paucivorans]